MRIIDQDSQPMEEWWLGVTTRMRTSLLTGCRQLCIFDQWSVPGSGAPTHVHAVEEVMRVVEGMAKVWVDDETGTLKAGQSVIVPAGCRHGFSNYGSDTLHMELTLAAPIFEASYQNKAEMALRWSDR